MNHKWPTWPIKGHTRLPHMYIYTALGRPGASAKAVQMIRNVQYHSYHTVCTRVASLCQACGKAVQAISGARRHSCYTVCSRAAFSCTDVVWDIRKARRHSCYCVLQGGFPTCEDASEGCRYEPPPRNGGVLGARCHATWST